MISTELKSGDVLFGFKVLSVKKIDEFRSTSLVLSHIETAMELLHLYNDEDENLFAFIFRTPPKDNTGVAHIVEHSVLAGSSRFPLKEPFIVLLKGSMNTFLNAFTFPDKTVYPASSTVEKDFYNLMLVYGDAVFSPLLREETFMQEGYHYEMKESKDESTELQISGVVYNEMKGYYSDPENIIGQLSLKSLFPGHTYGFDAGGDPDAITNLAFKDFLQFHHTHYHPSNAKVFLYGNIPTRKHLEFLHENFLRSFTRLKVDSSVPEKARWKAPKRVKATFPFPRGENPKRKSTVVVNWKTVPVTDSFSLVTMEVISELLVGNAGSSLRKDLVESGLGEDISPTTGLESELRELTFSVGLRGTDAEQTKNVEMLVCDCLSSLVEKGIDSDMLMAALHKVEFRNREIRGGGAPYSLRLMRRSLRGWLHGTAPEETLEFAHWMAMLKKTLKSDSHYLEKCIRKFLLDNPHRTTTLLYPDVEHQNKLEQSIRKKMDTRVQQLTAAERTSFFQTQARLKSFLEKPDSPQALMKIPSLGVIDVPAKVSTIPVEKRTVGENVPLYYHDLFANGVVYIDLCFEVDDIEPPASYYLPLFGRFVCESGLPGIMYDEIARRLALYSGGFYAVIDVSSRAGEPGNASAHICFRLKCLQEKVKDALKLVTRLLIEADLGDRDHLKDLILEMRNDMKASLLPNGNRFAVLRSGSKLSPVIRAEERWRGIDQILFIMNIATDMEAKIDETVRWLENVRRCLTRDRLIVNVTAENDAFSEIERATCALTSDLPVKEAGESKLAGRTDSVGEKIEAIVVQSPVSYVAHAFRGSLLTSSEGNHETVLSHFLRTGYLWEKVRMLGGAYGASARNDGLEGIFAFSSYRDPHIIETLEAYRNALEYVRDKKIDSASVEQAIIGTVGLDERPYDPGMKGFISLKRELHGITDDLRQKRRFEILHTNSNDLAESAQRLLKTFDQGVSAVLAGQDALNKASRDIPALKNNCISIPG